MSRAVDPQVAALLALPSEPALAPEPALRLRPRRERRSQRAPASRTNRDPDLPALPPTPELPLRELPALDPMLWDELELPPDRHLRRRGLIGAALVLLGVITAVVLWPKSRPPVRHARASNTRPAAASRPIRARTPEPPVPIQAALATPDAEPLRVRFNDEAGGVVVHALLRGPAGQRSVRLLYDTGATFTMVSLSVLQALGVGLTEVTLPITTVEGRISPRLAVLERVALGDAVVEQLTVASCQRCGSAAAQGLLGLNFSRHFVVSVDHVTRQLTLRRRELAKPRLLDIRPFVGLRWWDDRLEVSNRAPRTLRDLVLRLSTGTRRVPLLEPGDSAFLDLERNTTVTVHDARW
jgi:hypothetical protein